jgi:hypothetical protein
MMSFRQAISMRCQDISAVFARTMPPPPAPFCCSSIVTPPAVELMYMSPPAPFDYPRSFTLRTSSRFFVLRMYAAALPYAATPPPIAFCTAKMRL